MRMFSQQDQRKNENNQFKFLTSEQTDKQDHTFIEFKGDQNSVE